MDQSTAGSSVLHYLTELAHIYVHWSGDAIQPSHPLLPSIFPSIRVFSNESALLIRWPKYWRFSISPSSESSGLISFILCPNPEVLYQYLDIAIQSRKTGTSCSLHPLYSFCNYTTHTCKCKQKSCLEDQCSARHMHICWEANLTQWIRLALTHWKGNRQQSVGVNMQQRQTSSVSEEQEIINMADSTSSQ